MPPYHQLENSIRKGARNCVYVRPATTSNLPKPFAAKEWLTHHSLPQRFAFYAGISALPLHDLTPRSTVGKWFCLGCIVKTLQVRGPIRRKYGANRAAGVHSDPRSETMRE